MLPHVHAKDRNQRLRDRILILGGHDIQLPVRSVGHEPSPSTTLDTEQGGLEGLDELLRGPPPRDNGLLERRRGIVERRLRHARRRQVLPEKRVVDVPAAVELDLLLQGDKLRHVVGLDGLGLRGQGGVEVGDVGLVVLLVVQLHDLPGDDRFEGLKKSVSADSDSVKGGRAGFE